MNDHDDPSEQAEAFRKENQILKHKLEVSVKHQKEMEKLMWHTRALLETASAERMTDLKKKQLEIFSKFVPEEFLKSLSKESTEITLGDYVERRMTILFSDIVSFTTLSESMSPAENFKFVNSYLKRIAPTISLNNGFIDKFIGDGIMSLFYQADDAIKAGIAMQKELIEYNAFRANSGYQAIKIGVGLHTGQLMLGIIGVESRLQSTVISDAVNLSSRIEGLTRRYGAALLISCGTFAEINKDLYDLRFLGKMQVVGKTEVIEIYEVLNAEPTEIYDEKMRCKKCFDEGLAFYYDKKFEKAISSFEKSLQICPSDSASVIYLAHCREYLAWGIPENWCGIEVAQGK